MVRYFFLKAFKIQGLALVHGFNEFDGFIISLPTPFVLSLSKGANPAHDRSCQAPFDSAQEER